MELKNYWPEFLRELLEFQQIALAEQPEFSRVADTVRTAPEDFFLLSLTEYGASRWERILKITPKPQETPDERRFAILARFMEYLPYTIPSLKRRLDSLCGEDGYSVEVIYDEYALHVKVALTAKSKFQDVSALLSRVVPANMVIELDLKYNQHITLHAFAHEQLHTFTHDQLRNEVLDHA